MKQLILCALVGLCMAGCSSKPNGYVINGEMKGQAEGMVYLQSFRNKMFFNVDSTQIVDGKFTFTGAVDAPQLYGLATEDMRYPATFFLENVAMQVVLSVADGSVQVAGSDASQLYFDNAAIAQGAPYNIDSLVSKYPDSPVAAFYLYRYFTYRLSLDELKATRAKLSPSLASCPYVVDLDGIIRQLENVQIGKIAPEFSLPDTAGVAVSLSSLRGQVVLIDFWAAWCPPCRRENPNVVRAFQEYHDRGFTVLGVSLDFDRANWMKAIHDDHLTWTHVSDLKYWDSEIPKLYGVRGIPANVLIDRDGTILATNITGEALHDTLSKTMAR